MNEYNTCDGDVNVEVETFLGLSAEVRCQTTQMLDAAQRQPVLPQSVGGLDDWLWADRAVSQRHSDSVPLLQRPRGWHEPQLSAEQRPVLQAEVGLHEAAGRPDSVGRGVDAAVGRRKGDGHGGQDAAQLAVLGLDDSRTHVSAERRRAGRRRRDHRRRDGHLPSAWHRQRVGQHEQDDDGAGTLLADGHRHDGGTHRGTHTTIH